MTVQEAIESLQRAVWTDEDGEVTIATFEGPVDNRILIALEAEVGRLPDEFRDAAMLVGSAEGCGDADSIAFDGSLRCEFFNDLFPSGLPFASDGSEGTWFADLRAPGAVPIFYLSLDPPVMVLHCHGLATWIAEIAGGAAGKIGRASCRERVCSTV